jgi:hypothetical protein
MTTAITLTGPAAGDAQTLVAELLVEQIPVTTANNEELDRNVAQVAIDLGVSLFAAGTYETVKFVVRRWRIKRGLNESDVTVKPAEPPTGSPDNEPTE